MNERDELRCHAYLDGALPPAERSAFESDLAGDPKLRAELDALRQLDSELQAATASDRLAGDAITAKTLRALELEHGRGTTNSWRWAAALLGALLLGFAVAELLCVGRSDRSTANPPPVPSQPPRLTSVLGEVILSRANQKGGDSVQRGALWQVDDTLSTSQDSAALAEIPNLVEIALGENSTLTRIDDLHFELTIGHAIVLPDPKAPTLSISVPGVPAEVTLEAGGCEFEYVYPRNTKVAGPPLLRVRALAGPDGSARVQLGDRILSAGQSIRVGDGFTREDSGAPANVHWYVNLIAARNR